MVFKTEFFMVTAISASFCLFGDTLSSNSPSSIDKYIFENTTLRSTTTTSKASVVTNQKFTALNESTKSTTSGVPSATASSTTTLKSLLEHSQENAQSTSLANVVNENKPNTSATSKEGKENVVEDPHQLSVASVNKFLHNYFSSSTSANGSSLAQQTTEAPSVAHILHVISLATDSTTSTTRQPIISSVTSKKKKILVNADGPSASPLSAERRTVTLGAGNIIGIIFGVSVFLVGIAYIGLSYFPRTRRRSSYTEMFIHDHDDDEEIALTDYTEARAALDENV